MQAEARVTTFLLYNTNENDKVVSGNAKAVGVGKNSKCEHKENYAPVVGLTAIS